MIHTMPSDLLLVDLFWLDTRVDLMVLGGGVVAILGVFIAVYIPVLFLY